MDLVFACEFHLGDNQARVFAEEFIDFARGLPVRILKLLFLYQRFLARVFRITLSASNEIFIFIFGAGRADVMPLMVSNAAHLRFEIRTVRSLALLRYPAGTLSLCRTVGSMTRDVNTRHARASAPAAMVLAPAKPAPLISRHDPRPSMLDAMPFVIRMSANASRVNWSP